MKYFFGCFLRLVCGLLKILIGKTEIVLLIDSIIKKMSKSEIFIYGNSFQHIQIIIMIVNYQHQNINFRNFYFYKNTYNKMQRNQGNEEVSQVSSQSAPSRLENNECPICFETYTNQNRRYKVCEGKHYVCMNCILQLHTKQCPLCKRYFKIQRKQNNKLKILKGQREEQPIRFLHSGSVRALLLLIYARRHGQLPQQLIEALLMNDIDDNQSRISSIHNEQELNIVPRRQEQQNQQSEIQIGILQSQQNEQHDGEESSFSFISMHADRFNRNQEPRDRQRQQRNLQLSLHSQEQISQWSIDENANNNFQNQRRQISIDMEDMIQQKSCECSFFVALEQGFNKLLNLFRKQNKNQNQQEPIQV